MSTAPVTEIDVAAFTEDPYPTLARMRAEAPVTYVPQLGATLFTRRDDIFREEKRIDLFSSHQPKGLVEKIMGANLMRKDADAHQVERRALFPSLSPRTVRDHLSEQFAQIVQDHLARLAPLGQADLVRDYAVPVAADALRVMTGLTNFTTDGIDRASQEMIDGCANYARDPEIADCAHAASANVDAHIDARLPDVRAQPDLSVISVLDQAGLSRSQISGNIKVIIGGGHAGTEALGLRDDVVRENPAIRPTADAESIGIGYTARDGVVHARHHVLEVLVAPVCPDGLRKLLAVSRRTAGIDRHHGVPVGGKELRLEVEAV